MKSQFPGLSGSKQEANSHCHIASGGRFICRRKVQEWQSLGGGERRVWSTWAACSSPPPPLLHIMRWGQAEPLCIGLINSYSSSAWHPGNRSGIALGLIFRPGDDSRSIRAPLRQHSANFPELPKEAKGTEGENERVIERGIDDIEGWWWRRTEVRGVQRNRKGKKMWRGLSAQSRGDLWCLESQAIRINEVELACG